MPGQYSASDLDGSAQPARGKFSASDIDAPSPSLGDQLRQRANNVKQSVVSGVEQFAQPFLDVSAPKIALELYKHYKGEPNDLANIPRKAMEVFAQALAGEVAAPEAAAENIMAKRAEDAAAKAPVEQSVAVNVADRAATATAPFRKGPGEIAPDVVNPSVASRVLAGNQGTITTPPIPPRSGLALPGEVQPTVAPERVPVFNAPETFSGESALRQILTGQDNQALLKIARSRGLNVTKEALLKPGTGDQLLINKIIDDFSPEELDEIRAKYIENTRMGRAPGMGDIGAEAWKTLSLQTYFPELKLPQARLLRTAKAVQAARANLSQIGKMSPADARAAISEAAKPVPANEDLTGILQKSLQQAKKKRGVPAT